MNTKVNAVSGRVSYQYLWVAVESYRSVNHLLCHCRYFLELEKGKKCPMKKICVHKTKLITKFNTKNLLTILCFVSG